MKTIMLCYQELHDNDGVVLWYCFLQHFAGTTKENLIEACSQLSETKLQLHLFQDNILKFTNAVRAHIHHILKVNEKPSFQHFLTIFHSCLDASNEEFCSYVMSLYSDYRAGGPTKNMSILELLDKFDAEYNCINNLGRWTKRDNPQIHALTATISNLQSQLSTVTKQYGTLQALLAKNVPTPPDKSTKLQKPPPRQDNKPEVIEFKGYTWKRCDKCFNGTWNRTHVTAEHVAGVGKGNKNRKTPPTDNASISDLKANLAAIASDDSPDESPTPQANVAASSSTLNFF
jgi:hypothetical protein